MKNTNKKAIYAAYGIEYKNGKINAPVFGFIAPLLIDGNAKLGRGVWTFSTLPGAVMHTAVINGIKYQVKGTCPCTCNGCYAMTGFYKFSSTINALAIRTILAREYMDFVKRAISAQIIADGIKLLRIHAAGDFFSREYVEMWRDIAKNAPDCCFWTYTKNRDFEAAFDDLGNANIVKSIIPGKGFNFGHCDYILKVYRALKEAGNSVYICRCGMDKNQHCVNCKGCASHDFVLFIEHSTAYKAENDPLFPELCAIIDGQASQAVTAA